MQSRGGPGDAGMPPQLRRPRSRLPPGWELGLAVGCGVLSGFYIWAPVFRRVPGAAEGPEGRGADQ